MVGAVIDLFCCSIVSLDLENGYKQPSKATENVKRELTPVFPVVLSSTCFIINKIPFKVRGKSFTKSHHR